MWRVSHYVQKQMHCMSTSLEVSFTGILNTAKSTGIRGQFSCPRIFLLLLFLLIIPTSSPLITKSLSQSVLDCDFDSECSWNWNIHTDSEASFQNVSGRQIRQWSRLLNSRVDFMSGPDKDADNNEDGHFLYLGFWANASHTNGATQIHSPWMESSGPNCRLEADINIKNMDNQNPIKVMININNYTSWVPIENFQQEAYAVWRRNRVFIGKRNTRFKLIIEVDFGSFRPSYVAIDNIQMINCLTDVPVSADECSGIMCSTGSCAKRDQICDLVNDCQNGEDEAYCGTPPEGARCTFENRTDDQNNFCGWRNVKHIDYMDWVLFSGDARKDRSGPSNDHTKGKEEMGYYMLSKIDEQSMAGEHAMLESPLFDPPPCYHRNPASPYYETCQIRFFYHKWGIFQGTLTVDVVQERGKTDRKELTRIVGDKGINWQKLVLTIPIDVEYPYRIVISNARAARYNSDIGVDDITLSPECYGYGVPDEEAEKCPRNLTVPDPEPTSFINNGDVWTVSSCSAEGRLGPTEEQCKAVYTNMALPHPFVVPSMQPPQMTKAQAWIPPHDGYYTLIAKGASGGSGVQTHNLKTRGASARGVFYLHAGKKIFIVVGQEGESACDKTSGSSDASRKSACSNVTEIPDVSQWNESLKLLLSHNKNSAPHGGGGGGGGASFIWKMVGNDANPLIVAGAGGGLAWSVNVITEAQHGRGEDLTASYTNGQRHHKSFTYGAGPGGGLKGTVALNDTESGQPLLLGAEGGVRCRGFQYGSSGGFGGGGGGCLAGGGGGGYRGGDAFVDANEHGEGGYSFTGKGDYTNVTPAIHVGAGIVYIIRSFRGECGCDHFCVYLDEEMTDSRCVCGDGMIIGGNGTSCIAPSSDFLTQSTYIISVFLGFLVLVLVSAVSICLYKRYQHQKFSATPRDVYEAGHDMQLSRFRHNTNGMLTEYNPNYELGGGSCTLKDLKAVPRENLSLVKPLGQGAFGEVYQGYLKNYNGDLSNMPVAVKTLPETANSQSELDFLMEAMIMSKFNHPNIVHFLGVCFDKLPHFIVLELLSGGDLKSFLRESRPQPNAPSPLNMKSLLMCAVDVAKGCEYLEKRRFIHRDIAARNCLLTTKGPGRVVKIADFGMARDIYRNDYYRKGGKAMLPVKWMPPEAFLDGLFSSKTDIWSFGVLLWEVMSLGYMPYPGRGNQEVMQLVTGGGRLEPPANCPGPIYRIMTQCWHPIPDERPTFTTILERLGYCIQDPDVIASPLPVFQRPPSTERDATVMRPMENEHCLQISRPNDDLPISPCSADYLEPIPSSSYSLNTVRTDLNSTPSLDSAPGGQLERLIEDSAPPSTWETSFTELPSATPFSRTVPPVSVQPPPPVVLSSRTPTHIHSRGDVPAREPLLSSSPSESPGGNSPQQEMRERLLKAEDSSEASMLHPQSLENTKERRPHHLYHPHRYNNSGGSSNNSSSSNSSNSSSTASGSGTSSASTLPLDPGALPCIPPPLQYVNVDVKKRTAEFSRDSYVIPETREHREISC